MRIDILPRIEIDGYEEFETVANRYATVIQDHLNVKLADSRESVLDLGELHSSVVSHVKDTLMFVGPAPDESQRKIAEKSYIFGTYLGVLLSQPYKPELDTDNFRNAGSLEDIQLYVNCAPREYIRHRPNILRLIDRNLLQPVTGINQAKLVRNMAGLAVMQCEEGRLGAFILQEGAKLTDELEAMGDTFPDDWS